MGSKANGIGRFGIRVSAAIRAEAGLRRWNDKDLAQAAGKSAAYVHDRTHDIREWTLDDVGRICDAWGITPEKLLNSYPDDGR